MNPPDLFDLAGSIAAADPSDRVGLERLHRRVSELRDRASVAGDGDVAECLETATLMLDGALGLDPGAMQPFLAAVQRTIELCAGKVDGAAGDDVTALMGDALLGELLVQQGSVTNDDLVDVLRRQEVVGGRLGEMLVAFGVATEEQVRAALDAQVEMRGAAHAAEPERERRSVDRSPARALHDTQLGQLLLRWGAISREQLVEGLRSARATGARIGEALVQNGAISWNQLETAVRRQRGGCDDGTRAFLARWLGESA